MSSHGGRVMALFGGRRMSRVEALLERHMEDSQSQRADVKEINGKLTEVVSNQRGMDERMGAMERRLDETRLSVKDTQAEITQLREGLGVVKGRSERGDTILNNNVSGSGDVGTDNSRSTSIGSIGGGVAGSIGDGNRQTSGMTGDDQAKVAEAKGKAASGVFWVVGLVVVAAIAVVTGKAFSIGPFSVDAAPPAVEAAEGE